MCEKCEMRKKGINPLTGNPWIRYPDLSAPPKKDATMELIGDLRAEVEFLRGCLLATAKVDSDELPDYISESIAEYNKLRDRRTEVK